MFGQLVGQTVGLVFAAAAAQIVNRLEIAIDLVRFLGTAFLFL